MDARKINVLVQGLLAELYFINEDVIRLPVGSDALLNVFQQGIGCAKALCGLLFKVDFNNVVWRNTLVKQMLLEQIEEQKTFSTSPDTSDDLDEIIMFCRDKSVEVDVSIDQHRCSPNLIFVDEATYFKATKLYHIFALPRKAVGGHREAT